MEYRGKQYTVLQGLEPGSWKWSVQLDGRTRSGRAHDRQTGIKIAEKEIDRALAPKRSD
jgi:hypothetical protein